jgi:dihydrofolate reductase
VARLIYSAIASLDGYIEDGQGRFDWAEPDEEVFAFVNELERPIGTYLYGRRMYETMLFWETQGTEEASPPVAQDFARIWRRADKVVFSRSLATVSTARTRLESVFDPVDVRRLKDASEEDLTVGGPELAAEAMAAGLVDECHLLLHPVLVGAGKRALPEGVRANLELLSERRFASGVVSLRYGVSSD